MEFVTGVKKKETLELSELLEEGRIGDRSESKWCRSIRSVIWEQLHSLFSEKEKDLFSAYMKKAVQDLI